MTLAFFMKDCLNSWSALPFVLSKFLSFLAFCFWPVSKITAVSSSFMNSSDTRTDLKLIVASLFVTIAMVSSSLVLSNDCTKLNVIPNTSVLPPTSMSKCSAKRLMATEPNV